jgi:hypothetical protein
MLTSVSLFGKFGEGSCGFSVDESSTCCHLLAYHAYTDRTACLLVLLLQSHKRRQSTSEAFIHLAIVQIFIGT